MKRKEVEYSPRLKKTASCEHIFLFLMMFYECLDLYGL